MRKLLFNDQSETSQFRNPSQIKFTNLESWTRIVNQAKQPNRISVFVFFQWNVLGFGKCFLSLSMSPCFLCLSLFFSFFRMSICNLESGSMSPCCCWFHRNKEHNFFQNKFFHCSKALGRQWWWCWYKIIRFRHCRELLQQMKKRRECCCLWLACFYGLVWLNGEQNCSVDWVDSHLN